MTNSPEAERRSAYVSPILAINQELKRKNGGQNSNGANIDPWAADSNQDEGVCICGTASYRSYCPKCGGEPHQQLTMVPRHADALLESTPQLRVLCKASMDMQGVVTKPPGFLGLFAPDAVEVEDYNVSREKNRVNLKAAQELANLLWMLAHEITLEDYGIIESQVFSSIFGLVHSEVKDEKMAGLAALHSLLSAPSADEERKAIKFANTLSTGLHRNNDFEFLSAVSKALGYMATLSANVDFVESEITRALEWLGTDRSDRRLAACLCLKEFAEHLPTTFHSKTSIAGGANAFLNQINQAIRDPQPIVRACAADALSQCLKILVDRQNPNLIGLLCSLHFDLMENLDITKRNYEHANHGALLVVACMVAYTRDFCNARFEEICTAVLKFRNHEKALLRLEVVRLIPRLAQRFPHVYGRRYLEESLEFLMICANDSASRVGMNVQAFSALGSLISAMRQDDGSVIGGTNLPTIKIIPDPSGTGQLVELRSAGAIYDKLESIFALVRSGLRNKETVSPAMHCAADIVQALGTELAKPYLPALVDDMFQAHLSNDLMHCLHAIADCAPEKKEEIENRILESVSTCLAGRRYMWDPFKEPQEVTMNRSSDPDVVSDLVLGLETLESFGQTIGRSADGVVSLLPFIHNVVALYLSHPSYEVRKAAAMTCCKLLPPEQRRIGGYTGQLVEEVLSQLLRCAISDASPNVRLSVVRALDRRFDPYLCQQEHLIELFLLLQDESLSIRAAGVRLLGRLTALNAGPTLPVLRRFLNGLLLELRCGMDTGRMREEATRLLVVFLRAKPLKRLVHPVLPALVEALPLDKSSPPRLASASLEALGELAQAAGNSLKPWVREVVPHVLEIMEDRSSASKQRTSLRTLGQISGSTGYVIQPYLDYPQLLSQATEILPATKRAPWSLRREVIRTLGIVGALDPDRYHEIGAKTRKAGAVGGSYFVLEESIAGSQEESYTGPFSLSRGKSPSKVAAKQGTTSEVSDANSKIEVQNQKHDEDCPASQFMYEQYAMVAQPMVNLPPATRMTPSTDDFYSTVAIQALMRIFRDPNLAAYHGMVVQAVMFIFKSLGLECVPFLDRVVPHMVHAVKTCGPSNLRESLLTQLATLSNIVGEHLQPYISDIMDAAEQFWPTRHLPTIFSLISNLATGCPDDFKNQLPRILRRVLKSLDDLQVAEWKEPDPTTDSVMGKRRGDAETVRLMLKIICDLKVVLLDYLQIIIPTLLKLADSLMTLSHNGESHLPESMLMELTVLVLRTTGSLLETLTSNRSALLNPFGEYSTSFTPSSSNGPASRVVQPLVRLLLEKPPSSPTVGLAIVETICVCVSLAGRTIWLQLYDGQVRDAIRRWQLTFPVPVGKELPKYSFRIDERVASCLDLYDEAIEELALSLPERTPRSMSARDSFQFGLSEHVPPDEISLDLVDQATNQGVPSLMSTSSRQKINQGKLQVAWDASQRTSREDWEEWMRRLGIQLLREAPSPALQATANLAHAYQPLARELFSAAFACCWNELSEPYQQNLVQSLKSAFVADVSPEILQALLNLAEFMEHALPGGFPIEISILADLALKCRAYAKALYYKEREYASGGSISCVESLVAINSKLDLPEAALGILAAGNVNAGSNGDSDDADYARNVSDMCYSVAHDTDASKVGGGKDSRVSIRDEVWLARLGAWTQALAIYQAKLERNPCDAEAMLGCMRCFVAHGEWQKVLDMANQDYQSSSLEWLSVAQPDDFSEIHTATKKKAARMCSQAAWRLGRWEELEKFSAKLVEPTQKPMSMVGTNQTKKKPSLDYDGAFYKAIVCVHNRQWNDAATAIDSARRAMDGTLTALMAENYSRAYPSMVTAQSLAELEEIVEFGKLEEQAEASSSLHKLNRPNVDEARKNLLSVWRERLSGCRPDSEVYASILAVRSLVLEPEEEIGSSLKLSELSRQSQRFKFGERVLLEPLRALGADFHGPAFGFRLPEDTRLRIDLSSVPIPTMLDRIVSDSARGILPDYGEEHARLSQALANDAGGRHRLTIQYRLYLDLIRHLWAADRKDEAMQRLEPFCDVVSMVSHYKILTAPSLPVDCWLELGEWKLNRAPPAQSPPETTATALQVECLAAFRRATMYGDCGYRAWHAWALLNFRMAHQTSATATGETSRKVLTNHVLAAVKGFVGAITKGTKRDCALVQQDLLNLLTCLFQHGNLQDVAPVWNEAIKEVAMEAWLGVLPQLLARIHIKEPAIRGVLHRLLTKLGELHPQAMMYPLSVLLKNPVADRKSSAESLMHTLKSHSSALVQEALMVSSELIRVAILWLETWHEGLEEASRLHFQDGNVPAMLETLVPLHEQLEKGAETKRENHFLYLFGEDLETAYQHIKTYIQVVSEDGVSIPTAEEVASRHSELAETTMNKAWNIYYTVFRRINMQLPSLTKLELNQCSPALSRAHGLELCVPGTYRVDGSYVNIEKFIPNVEVITSKQRPRKITMRGSDGRDYMFLLKGHEDLRQDERVMQLFGLVNALLVKDPKTRKQDLQIQRYAISPLSHNCGVVGWVPHADTLHTLIRDYRHTKNIPLNTENREMLKLAPDFELLTVMQKAEVFIEALKKTPGQGNDLAEIMWLKSTNSEEWLEQRTKYTRSLAVMSMVGYILGLGDRHPSNLMLNKLTGRILHIDFGDCFEVAMNREKFPEKVPFRLTRMLIKAMEISGIEGSYRSTCEKTMHVLRESRDSLVAMLEAFVYDPLISWRLADLSKQSGEEGSDAVLISTPSPGVPVELSGQSNALESKDDERIEEEEVKPRKAQESTEVPPDLDGRERSQQIHADIQNRAAQLLSDSRINSIAGDAQGSIAHSRLERSMKQREFMSLLGGEKGAAMEHALNEKALKVIRRVEDKLNGTDFPDTDGEALDVADQVQRLILQATSSENLCQCFVGWCSFW